MFFCSAVGTQLCASWLGLSPTAAAFTGSALSGYFTGTMAALAEWRKVLTGQRLGGANKSGRALVREAVEALGRPVGIMSVGRRLHAAGVRNGIFDAVFFGTRQALQPGTGKSGGPGSGAGTGALSNAGAYGLAAATAVVVDYAVDVAAKRRFALPPSVPVGPSPPCSFVVSLIGGRECTRIYSYHI